jgi:hypothetical protein
LHRRKFEQLALFPGRLRNLLQRVRSDRTREGQKSCLLCGAIGGYRPLIATTGLQSIDFASLERDPDLTASARRTFEICKLGRPLLIVRWWEHNRRNSDRHAK